ncbi:hypothetical protein [Paraburkholderia pallida]|uniref:Uncharacterized protein n=1 Tax=Paraburkholderia pallida TaxID=2547399 RepID=A0A4P7CRC8_9BURK|nr:hypothetical protein [Paraburkholderia pallida]QBQ96293.1 hypothetical protein E1956_03305 [Paraburkholderia pallida]
MKLLNFGRAQFSEADARKLNDLIHSPEGQRKLEEADKYRVERRAELKKRLDSLNATHDAAIDAAAAKRWEADRNLKELRERSQLQIREAEKANALAVAAVSALEQAKNKEYFDIRLELQASRDLRTDEYFVHIGNALSMINHFAKATPVHTGFWNVITGKPNIRMESNNKEVLAAMSLLREAQKKLEEMVLLPLSRSEIDDQLKAISREIRPTLDQFSQPYPILNADGDVELSSPRLRSYYALEAAGAATNDDTPPVQDANERRHARNKSEIGRFANGAPTIGDLGPRRVRGSRASGSTRHSAQGQLHSQELDDLE